MKQATTTAGHLSALFTAFVWGTTFIITKILLKDFHPIEILFIRFLIGFLTLCLVYPHRLKTERRQEWLFALAGLTGVTLYFLLENIALTYSLASNVGVIVSIAPFFTAIFAHFFLDGEKLKPNFFLGFIAAIAGIFLISFAGSTTLKINPLGDGLSILAAICWGLYSVIARKISTYAYPTLGVTRHIFFYGILFMLPALFLFDIPWNFAALVKPINMFGTLFLGFVASALCFATWNYATRVLGAVKTSIYIYMVPVVTVVTSAIVLHEKITIPMAIGTMLTLLGLVISESKWTFRKAKAKTQ